MTTINGATGETGPFFMPGTKIPEVTSGEPGGGHTRRRFLIAAGMGAGALLAGVGVALGPRFLGPESNTEPAQREGDTARAGANGVLFEKPSTGDITIDPANPYHIQEVTQNSREAQQRIRKLFGTPELQYVNPSSSLRHPWLQISSNTGAHLTMSLRPARLEIAPGERVPTWDQARRPETAFVNLYTDTVALVSDRFPFGQTIANVTGWTNIGTPNERMFTVDTQHMQTLAGMQPEARRNELLGFTHALFQARALG